MDKLNILFLIYVFPFRFQILFADDVSSSGGGYCEIREPTFATLYNFTKLVDPTKDILVPQGEYSEAMVRMQLCSPLVDKCNGKDNYTICLMRNGKETGIGKGSPKITNEPGKILFLFNGDDCEDDVPYTVNILMKCDYESTGYSYPAIFSRTKCKLYIIWKTEFACGPRTHVNCTVEDHGDHYDLGPLTRYSENYVISTSPDDTSPKIILNVCHSVIFENGAICQLTSGACLRDSTSASGPRYQNLGDVLRPPFFGANGELKLEYRNGNICKAKDVPHVRTTITFICDYKATIDTIPEYVKGSEECHYQLVWKTAAACKVESLRNHSVVTAGQCTVANPLSNFTYDLRSLRNKEFSIRQDGTEYKVSVCGPLADRTCGTGTGVCRVRNHTSSGKANANLTWRQGGPYLNYTDGEICKNNTRRYTVIAFVCGPEGSPSGPLIMEDRPCQLVIHWNIDIVCEKRTKCATKDDEFNLAPLIRSTSNYVVNGSGVQFHINVCRPLVATATLTCAHGSAVCKAVPDSTGRYTNETSLGFAEESPRLVGDRHVRLRYQGGSPCPERPDDTISSNFTFSCDYGNERSTPEFRGYVNCTYLFEWKTSIVCGAVTGRWYSPCTIEDQFRTHDLSPLYEQPHGYKVKGAEGKLYDIAICGGANDRNGSAVRQGTNGYGSLASVVVDYSRDVIKLQYSNGSKCGNETYTSEVRILCNRTVGIGQPVQLWEWPCSAGFEWHSNVACVGQGDGRSAAATRPPSTTDTPRAERDDRGERGFDTSHVGTVAAILLTGIGLLTALVYLRDPSNRSHLRSCFNSLALRRGAARVRYCRVNTTEEARLLLDASDPTQCQTDSDDDLLAV